MFVVSEPAVIAPRTVAPPFNDVAPVTVKVPVALRFLNPEASKLPSTTTALFAATVPFVIPSIFSKSVSSISAEPIMKDPPDVILPDDDIAPLNDVVWSALKVAAVDPPVAMVITSDPLKVIDVFESASPLIESTDKLPTFEMF